MIQSLIIGIGGIVFLMILWFFVQAGWRNSFADSISDDDVLVGRSSCSTCGCTTICEKKLNQVK